MPATQESKSATTTRKRKSSGKALRLDLACGQSPAEGFTGVDIWDGADIQHDLTRYPWPWKDRSVSELHCSHYVEHIPFEVLRPSAEGIPEAWIDGLCAFMNECHRILKKNGQFTIRHPHNRSDRAFQDPTHRRFIPAATWWYFNKEWRDANKLNHYPITADFEVVSMFADGLNDDLATRNQETQLWAGERYWNMFADLVVVLKKR